MTTAVSTGTNLFDYFNLHVETARTRRGVEISSDTSLYLAKLLADRARSDRPAPPEETLAELHARAANAPPTSQARTYQELGDRALYLLGYFAESLSRRIVGPDYYAEMGAAAYHRVDKLFKALFSDAFGPVFQELAHRFRDCVGVLGEVREAHQAAGGSELLTAYEAWLKTGDEALASKLVEKGMLLPTRGLIEA